MTPSVDYDLHGAVGVRLLDAARADVAAVDRQLGPLRGELQRDPDITLRFVDHLPVDDSLTYLGLNDAAFSSEAFFILKGKHKADVKVQVPFEGLGGRVELVCERGLPAVPLLIAILNLTALCKGLFPLHATAFEYNGAGSLVTGWSKGGKTETLLAFMSNGARYIGDEWVYISPDGRRLFGIPEPIRVWDWHLDELPHYRAALPRQDRLRLRSLAVLEGAVDLAGRSRLTRRTPVGKLARRLEPTLKRQQYVHLPPHQTFGPEACPLQGSFDCLFFVASHASAEVVVREVDPLEVAARMTHSLVEERRDLLSYYRKFRFAFPDKKNELLERFETLQQEALQRVVAGKKAFAVFHPYPVALPALYEAIHPNCR
jgi:hypothetical protein